MTPMRATFIAVLVFVSLAFALPNTAAAVEESRASIARQILANSRITLATVHPSGVRDNATAHQNIVDTANGREAHRSCYGTAPCGSVWLDTHMLAGLRHVGTSFRVFVSEIAGGSHTAGSAHYAGRAFDISVIDGVAVSPRNAFYRGLMATCRAAGATLVLGPNNDANHQDHVHCQW